MSSWIEDIPTHFSAFCNSAQIQALGLFVKIVQLLNVNWKVPSESGITNGTLQVSYR